MMRMSIRFFLFSFLTIALSACYREQTTIVTVLVKNTSGNLIENAQVRLYAEPTGTAESEIFIDMTKNSNSKGEAYFNLSNVYEPGQNGVAILAVSCQKLNLTGQGVIEVRQEENNLIDIIIQ